MLSKKLNRLETGWRKIILESNLDLSSFTATQAMHKIKETPTRDGPRKSYPQHSMKMDIVLKKHSRFTYVRLTNKLGNIWTYIGDEKNAD